MSLKKFKATLATYSMAAVILLFPIVSPFNYAVKAFIGNGTGTLLDPYLITSCDELQDINSEATASYKLINNINTDDCTSPFTPLDEFSGDFDGNAKIITLNITSSALNAGLFTILNGASIYNLALTGSVTSSNHNVGSVAGYAHSGSILSGIKSDVSVTADGTTDAGGLVGETNASQIFESYFEGVVSAYTR